MGCDIHAFIEYGNKHDDDKIHWMDFAKVHISRDYGIFHCLAGVRGYDAEVNPIAYARGVPEDIGFMAKEEYELYITDTANYEERHASKEDAEKWLKSGSSIKRGEHYISNPDYHSGSWLELSEVKEAYKRYLNYYQKYISKPDEIKTYEEFKKFIEDTKEIRTVIERNADIEAVIACMESLSLNHDKVRLVFWFDN